jgi:phosphohistidine phosphatase
MQLVVIRHAIAEDQEAFAKKTGLPDTERPITKHGRRAMKRIAKGLHRVVKSIDVLAASPLVRAAQTAAIVSSEYDDLFIETVPALAQGVPSVLAKWLRTHEDADVVAIVGHEPYLGILVTWLLSGLATSHVEIDKGGVCLLDIEGSPGARSATLRWALTPEILKKLSRK